LRLSFSDVLVAVSAAGCLPRSDDNNNKNWHP